MPSPRARKPLRVYWNPPNSGVIKLNTDGAFMPNSSEAACGGLMRDSERRILLAFESYLGTSSILEAELKGVWMGLSLCKENDWNIVCLESDSKIALHLIQSDNTIFNWKVCSLVEKIKKLSMEIQVTAQHLFREGNKAAD